MSKKCDYMSIRLDTVPDGWTDRIGKTISHSVCISMLTRNKKCCLTLFFVLHFHTITFLT